MSRGIGTIARTFAPAVATALESRQALYAAGQGGLYGGVFTPVKQDADRSGRLANAVTGAGTFAVLARGGSLINDGTGYVLGLMGRSGTTLSNGFAGNGFLAGMASAQLESITHGNGPASLETTIGSGLSMALTNKVIGAAFKYGESKLRSKTEAVTNTWQALRAGRETDVSNSGKEVESVSAEPQIIEKMQPGTTIDLGVGDRVVRVTKVGLEPTKWTAITPDIEGQPGRSRTFIFPEWDGEGLGIQEIQVNEGRHQVQFTWTESESDAMLANGKEIGPAEQQMLIDAWVIQRTAARMDLGAALDVIIGGRRVRITKDVESTPIRGIFRVHTLAIDAQPGTAVTFDGPRIEAKLGNQTVSFEVDASGHYFANRNEITRSEFQALKEALEIKVAAHGDNMDWSNAASRGIFRSEVNRKLSDQLQPIVFPNDAPVTIDASKPGAAMVAAIERHLSTSGGKEPAIDLSSLRGACTSEEITAMLSDLGMVLKSDVTVKYPDGTVHLIDIGGRVRHAG